jgi:hypothetical protein
MNKRIAALLLACGLMLSMLVACGGSAVSASSGGVQVESSAAAEAAVAATAAVSTADSVAEAAAENGEDHENADDYASDGAEAVEIVLNGDSIAVDGKGATVDGSKVTITSAGTYRLTGALTDGQIIVDTEDKGTVRLVLNGVELSSSTNAPIYVVSAKKTVIVLADGTANHLSDGDAYVLADEAEDEPNAAIFSKGDLTITGDGALDVDANYNGGIASKDGLIIAGGTIAVSAADDGIRGKDYVIVKGGDITVDAGGDGLKSDNEEDATKGYVLIEDGVLNVTAGGDSITAQTDVLVADGEIILASGGGSSGRIDESASAKGIKGVVSVVIDGGSFTIDSADDAIHSNGGVAIQGGSFTLTSGDDGVHADATVEVNGGDIRITHSYEGIESAIITINDGEIHIVASDDGLNVAGGIDGSGMNPGPGRGGDPGARPAQDSFTASGNYYLYVNGGTTVLDTAGDGLDINGSVVMTDGTVIVNGPTEQMNGALDYDGSFRITGGTLVAVGSAGMAQAPDTSSTQASLLLNLSSAQPAGTLVHIETSEGDELLTFAPAKQYQSIAFSSPELVEGSTVDVYTGGNSTGAVTDGLYQGGTYAPGTKAGSLTLSGIVTRAGSRTR